MKYTLKRIDKIHYQIKESRRIAGNAYHTLKGWIIFTPGKYKDLTKLSGRFIGEAKTAEEIIPVFVKLKGKVKRMPYKKPLCDHCPLKLKQKKRP
jgi:hypothetical protein